MSQICSHNIWQGTRDIMCADIFKRKIAGHRHIPPKLSSLPHTGHIQTPLPMCPFPNSIVEGFIHVFAPRFRPIAVQLGNEWIRTSISFYPTREVSAPDEVLNLVSCGCKTGYEMALCFCVKFTLTCLEFANL